MDEAIRAEEKHRRELRSSSLGALVGRHCVHRAISPCLAPDGWGEEVEDRDVILMALIGSWAMVRRPKCAPYVCGVKEILPPNEKLCNSPESARGEHEKGHGSATPSRRMDYCIHGFNFASPEDRQAVAEGHHLWPSFVEFWSRRYYGKPSMDEEQDRELFEFFVEGGWNETSQNDNNQGSPTEVRKYNEKLCNSPLQ